VRNLLFVLSSLVLTALIAITFNSEESLQADPGDTVTIAVIQDGPSPLLEKLTQNIETETKKLVGDDTDIVFHQMTLDKPWDPPAIATAIREAEQDPNIKAILGVGILVTQVAEAADFKLEKPTVTSFLQRSEVDTLPITSEGTSSKENYIFSVINLPITRDIRTFHELVPFRTLAVLVDERLLENLPDLAKRVQEVEKQEKIKIRIVPALGGVQATLRNLGNAEAVLITPLMQMDHAQVKQLIEGINKRGIPSFSSFGYADVAMGAMAAVIPDTIVQTARQTALNLQQVIQGKPLNTLPVLMPVKASLLLNAKTVKRVRYSPSLMTLVSANFINRESLRYGEKLSLHQAMKLGGANNIDLSIAEANIRTTRQLSNISRSNLLPQAIGSIQYSQIDADRATGSLGLVPQRLTTGNIGLSQMIYNDTQVSNLRSSRREVERFKYIKQSTRLDATQRSGVRFVELLAAQAILKIAWENLDLTLTQLEIARLKYEVGTGGRDEIYRWEVQENQQRGELFRRYADLERALVALNQSLNEDQLKQWQPVDFNYEQVQRYFMGNRLNPIIRNTRHLKNLRVFLVDQSLHNSPEIAELRKQAEAEGIQLGQRKRRFFLPDFGANFNYTNELQAQRPAALFPASQFENQWLLGLNATLPLFQGGRRFSEVKEVKARLMRIGSEVIRRQQLLEQQTLSDLYAVESSYFNLDFSRKAAESAKLNFDIVQLKYTEGIVNIIDMLDAQNEYIARSQEAAVAIYIHLIDLINLQRSIAWFEMNKTEVEKEKWVLHLRNVIGG